MPALAILFLTLFSCFVAAAERPTAEQIIQRSIDRDGQNEELAKNYTMTTFTVEKSLDSDGKVKSTETTKHDFFFLYGEPVKKLIEKDGKPLPPEDARKEEERLNKLAAKRAKESEDERQKRVSDWDKRRRKQREFLKELPKAYAFTLAGEEELEGRKVWVLDGVPRPEYKPRDLQARVLTKFKGRLWIDQADYQWARAEAESIDNVSFGLFIARLNKGARIAFEMTKVNSEVWLPKAVRVKAEAKLGLVKTFRQEVVQTMSGYRRFQSESRIVSVDESAAAGESKP